MPMGISGPGGKGMNVNFEGSGGQSSRPLTGIVLYPVGPSRLSAFYSGVFSYFYLYELTFSGPRVGPFGPTYCITLSIPCHLLDSRGEYP